MVPLANAALIGAFARSYREDGALPGEAGSALPEPTPALVWPEYALPNFAALVLLGTLLLLLWWRHLRRETGGDEPRRGY